MHARTASLAFALVAAGCCSPAGTPTPTGDPAGARWVVPEEVFDPRMAAFTCPEDPGRPRRTLDLWLDLLGTRVVRERGEGEARLRCGTGEADRREFDYLVLWRPVEEGIEVQVTTAPAPLLGGDYCRRALSSLAFAMEAKEISVEFAPPSGCLPPENRPAGAQEYGDALARAFTRLGLVRLRDSAEQDANVSFYGPPGGAPEWRVDWKVVNRGCGFTVELFHDAVPFDAKGERDLLGSILKSMGTVPFGLYPDGPMPSRTE